MHLVVNTDEHSKGREAWREGLNSYLTYELVLEQFWVKRKEKSPNIYNENCPSLKAMKNSLEAF